ncbi:MAG TPA: hypothetical protein VFZ09_46290 [Archangium sp.]|uniref:hypothetical protein n=1 Tax=Archangium sp. TaxID=1872627 RepID=UPI002E2F441F|nr:hypothetical protein [Archangium sp.]HEX5753688.1 hypothetical protein [Archangium sp.]
MRMIVLLSLWLTILEGCAAVSGPMRLGLDASDEHGSEIVALGPKFFRTPRIRNTPSLPVKPPPAEQPKPQASQPKATQQPKPAGPSPLTKILDPKVARENFDKGQAEARTAFPHLFGKPKQKHHLHPKYLGGVDDGPTVDVDPAYHQLITNAFRREHPYGQEIPSPAQQQEIMRKVYAKYPLPGVHF